MINLPIDIQNLLAYLEKTYGYNSNFNINNEIRDELKKTIISALNIPLVLPWTGFFKIEEETGTGYHGSYANREIIGYDIKFEDISYLLKYDTDESDVVEFKKNFLDILGKVRTIKEKYFPITIIKE